MRAATTVTALIILALFVGVLSAPWIATAQPPGKVYRVGWLSSGSRTATPVYETFQRKLRELGYVEGRNLALEGRWAEGDGSKVPGLAAELVRAGVDVIVTVVSGPTRAAMNATTTIPIVMIGVGSPVQRGFVASLARPGGNVTGLSSDAGAGVYGKRLQLLREALTRLLRMVYLADPTGGEDPAGWKAMQDAAKSMNIALERVEAGNSGELDNALTAIVRVRPDAVYVTGTPLHFTYLTRIHEVTLRNRIPVMHLTRVFVEAGGLMSYGPDILDFAARSAIYVDKILKGAWPGDLPVERPTKFELIINLKTARALGLTIPPSLLQRADEVIR